MGFKDFNLNNNIETLYYDDNAEDLNIKKNNNENINDKQKNDETRKKKGICCIII